MLSWILPVAIVTVVAAALLWRARKVTIVYPPMVALLYRDGRFVRELPPGRHVWFDPFARTRLFKVSLAEIPTPLGEFTVLSRDQFSFRLALAPVLKIVDPQAFSESQPASEAAVFGPLIASMPGYGMLHPMIAAAAGEVVGARKLAEVMADQNAVTDAVKEKLDGAIPGATVVRVLLTAINLPPETRRMFTDVERARMEAQAALERARGEHAALRVLANAARLAADNPALANLRLLQTIESAKGNTTIVFGNPGAAAGIATPPVGGKGA